MTNKNDFDEKLLLSRALDCVRKAQSRGEAAFLPFLSAAARLCIEQELKYSRDDLRLIFYGGYDDADYMCAGFFPSYLFYDEEYDPYADFPIKTVFAKGSGFRKLTHRDFLGSAMSLGLRREMMGDIVVAQDGFSAYIFAYENTGVYLVSFFNSAANDRIVCSLCTEKPDIPERKFESVSDTVSSPRLDAIVCSCLNVSRDTASKLIAAGSVSLDHAVCYDKSEMCDEGCTISIRHYGRFLLYKIGDRNRRDRLRIEIRRFV